MVEILGVKKKLFLKYDQVISVGVCQIICFWVFLIIVDVLMDFNMCIKNCGDEET